MRQLNKHQFLFPLPPSLLSTHSASSSSPLLPSVLPSPLLGSLYLISSPLLSSPLLSFPPPLPLLFLSSVTPDKVSISACWLSHCRLYACLTLTGTLGTGNTHHRMPITLPHVSGRVCVSCLYACVCVCVCVCGCVCVERGDEGVKCLLRWESGLSYTGENSPAPKEQKIAMLLFLTPH